MKKTKKVIKRAVYLVILLLFFIVGKVLLSLYIEGKENIPDNTDDLLITSTHTSYWDPPIIGITFGPKYLIHFIARESLLSNPFFTLPVRTFSTTINRDNFGKKDLVKLMRVFKEKGLICIFPEGTTEDAPPKSGTIRLAEKTNRRFLPVKINLIRHPLEFPFLFAPVKVTIGKAISLDELKRSSHDPHSSTSVEQERTDYRKLSLELMQRIRSL